MGPEEKDGWPGGQPVAASTAAGGDIPSLSLPKAGGAIRGMGEKFATSPVTGTASLTVPIPLTPARGAGTPQLALSHDSGAGNGPYGLGWTMGYPSITRRTDKARPRYVDDGPDADIFQLTGAEDLVPALRSADGGQTWQPMTREDGDYDVAEYRPRTEGGFIRIERWRNRTSRELHWRTVSRDNVTTTYGTTAATQIADPADPRRVFRWLATETRDDRGNIITYEYKPEDTTGVRPAATYEQARLAGTAQFTNRYLKRIRYGNAAPGAADGFIFQVVLDYGEHDVAAPTPEELEPWPMRADPFSTYKPGFEVRTYRLCRRILIFHTFPELDAVKPQGRTTDLIRSTDLTFREDPALTYLTAITQTGYRRNGAGYTAKSPPPLELSYSERQLNPQVQALTGDGGPPVRLDGDLHRWVDLDSEGIAGMMSELAGGWTYRRNLGTARIGPPRQVSPLPVDPQLRVGTQQLLDLAAEGRLDLVQLDGPMPGSYPRTPDGGWDTFTPFTARPQLSFNDPNLRFADLTGSGRSDILITTGDQFTWYPCLGRDGYGPATVVSQPGDEDRGPHLVFADGTQSIYLMDATGDGSADLVRVRNGQISYWPNLGYGRFGPKVQMSGAPVFDRPDRFDQRLLRPADVDGSGTTDLIYLHPDGPRFYFNQAGNSWSPAHTIPASPVIDSSSLVSVTDALGLGTACLLIASPWPDGTRQVQLVDLMGGVKPHLLTQIRNNHGAETQISYASSTSYYLADGAVGHPWVTRLPFPVQVISQVEIRDLVAGTKLVTTYSYRHGYYDGVEREFRGFGYVEQHDSESGLFTPPAVTRSWYHTGDYTDRTTISRRYASEYWAGTGPLLPDTPLPADLSPQEDREACRALRGQLLHQEIYADDGTDLTGNPYSVTEHTYQLRRIQPQAGAPYCVVACFPAETLTVHTERRPEDPRISHDLILEVDDYGNVIQSASAAYPRHNPADPEQQRLWARYTEHDVTNTTADPATYRIGVPVATRDYEIGGIPPGPTGRFDPATLTAAIEAIPAAGQLPPETEITGTDPQQRLIALTRTTYYTDDLTGELPDGQIGSRALPYHTYQQAWTPGLLDAAFAGRVTEPALTEAGYLPRANGWERPSGRHEYDPGHFYLPTGYLDPFAQRWTTGYDPHYLLPVRLTDPLRNATTAQVNYRLVQPYLLTDPNGNRTGVRFDELGMVIATAVMGKPGADEGDVLDMATVEASAADDPTTRLVYDLTAYQLHGTPVSAHTYAREQHGPANPRWQEAVSYTDGSGRQALTKTQAAPGLAPKRGADGELLRNPDGTPELLDTSPEPRWVGTGRTIYDNKGNPVKKYEPYFAPDDDYDTEPDLVNYGVTPVLHYDPLSRLTRTDFPDGTLARVEFTTWDQAHWDQNDTVRESGWYATREALPAGDPERRAADQTTAHARTPTQMGLDPLGRTYLTIADNGGENLFPTRVALDIQGNERAVTDARGIPVLQQQFDMLGHPATSISSDAGQRWTLLDITGQPTRAWDSRSHATRMRYDQLRRLTHRHVATNGGAEQLRERRYYGEAATTPETRNQRTRLIQVYDGAGVNISDDYDFKGNLRSSTRQLADDYTTAPDWAALDNVADPGAADTTADPQLTHNPDGTPEVFTTRTVYDALSRPTLLTSPDGSQTRPGYNEANLVKTLDAAVRGVRTWTSFVANVNYNARGQRVGIDYGNGTTTTHTYDQDTFRLTNLSTTRSPAAGRARRSSTRATRRTGAPTGSLQNLSYTYDPVGNIVVIADGATQTLFFANAVVSPDRQFVYDPTYRLTQATGREHIGQTDPDQPGPDDPLRFQIPHVNDAQAMRAYTETYTYDPVGNIKKLAHVAGVDGRGDWARHYTIAADNNRLTATSKPSDPPAGPYTDTYTYDTHGNMTSIPSLPHLDWDDQDRLTKVDLGGGSTAYYQYDATGQRVRATVESNGTRNERLYLGAAERFRRYNRTVQNEQQTLHVLDGQRRVALVETITKNNGNDIGDPVAATRYQLANHLQSVLLELDDTSAILTYEEYHPYGTTSYQAAAGIAQTSLKRYRYTGKEKDQQTGFTYHNARYYACWLGRWINPDPTGIADGTNTYSYVHGRPTTLKDSNGRYAEAGHFYTVFAVALISGMPADIARRIAIFAQAPDAINELNAVPAGYAMAIAENNRLVRQQRGESESFGSRQEYDQIWEKGTFVQSGLHSLTGAASEGERTKRAELALAETPGSPAHGLAIHAFGDSFAHTRIEDWQWSEPDLPGPLGSPFTPQHEYQPPLGHAGHFHEPDKIERRPGLYVRYATNLHRLLSMQAPKVTGNYADTRELTGLLNQVTSAKSEAEQTAILKQFISSHGGTLDYLPETAGSLPYAQARTDPRNPREFSEISVTKALDTGYRWTAKYPYGEQTVEQFLDRRSGFVR